MPTTLTTSASSRRFVCAVTTALLAAVCSLALLSCGDAKAGPLRIVALGDSSASGPGLGPKYPDAPPECDRTYGGYAALVATRVVHQSFLNETCSGAVTSSLTGGWTYPSGNHVRPQLSALDGSESVVLLSIGDNDADFGTVTNNCLWHNHSNDDVCTQTYMEGSTNKLIAKAQSVGGAVGASIDAIRARSPKAEIFLVGYIDLAPRNGVGCDGLLWLTWNDAPVFDDWEVALNETLRSTAASHGAHFVDVYSQSADHTACAAQPSARWVYSYVGPAEMVALHPTPAGADAVANLVIAAMQRAGVELGPEARVDALTFKRLRPASRGGVFSRNAPARGGAPISLLLDQPALVSFKLEHVTTGRRVGGHCKARTKKNRRHSKCLRTATRGKWWSAQLPSGRSEIYVTGRNKGRRLAKGRYRVRLRSSNTLVDTYVTKTFSIVR